MKNINVLVIGAGLYVCGKGTEGCGTILKVGRGVKTVKKNDLVVVRKVSGYNNLS